MELSGPLSPEMLQGLQSMMMQNPGSASGNYRPRFTAPDISASQGFSLAQTLGRFGEGAGMAGMVGDMLLPKIFQSYGGGGLNWADVVNRINLARGTADPIREVQSREYAQVMTALGTQDLGRAAVGALGLQQGSMFANVLMSGAPMIDQLTGGLVSDAARLVDPNLMTGRGGSAIIAAQRGRNTMHRLDSAMAGHLKNTLQERSRLNYRGQHYGDVSGELGDFMLRDNVLTSGMNLDDFAETMAMAVDLNALDYSGSLRGQHLKDKATKTLTERVGAGKFTASDLEAEMKAIRLAGATVQGGANVARVISTLGSTLGEGMSVGQRGELAAQLGMIPGSSADSANFQDILRNLKALGEAAGMTSKQMLDAGTVITRQFGGNQLINIATASMSQATMRLTGQALNDAGVSGVSSTLAAAGSRLAMDNIRAQGSDLMRAVAWGYTDPEFQDFIKDALGSPDGGAKMMQKLGTAKGRSLLSRSRAATDPQMQDALTALAAAGYDLSLFEDTGISEGQRQALTRTGYVSVKGKRIDLAGVYQKFAGMDLEAAQVLHGLGNKLILGTDDAAKFAAAAKATGLDLSHNELKEVFAAGGHRADAAIYRLNSMRVAETVRAERDASAMKQNIASLLTGTLSVSGMGEALAQLKSGTTDLASVKGLMGVLEASHLMLPGDRVNVLNALKRAPESQRKKLSATLLEFYNTQVEVNKATGDKERLEALSPRLHAAEREMHKLGLRTLGAGSLLGRWGGEMFDKLESWGSEGLKRAGAGLTKLAMEQSAKNDDGSGGGKPSKENRTEVGVIIKLTPIPGWNAEVAVAQTASDATLSRGLTEAKLTPFRNGNN